LASFVSSPFFVFFSLFLVESILDPLQITLFDRAPAHTPSARTFFSSNFNLTLSL